MRSHGNQVDGPIGGWDGTTPILGRNPVEPPILGAPGSVSRTPYLNWNSANVIDLLQHHEVLRLEDPDRIFAEGGAQEAMLEAKKAGKVRFIGFTGHKDPLVHLRMLEVAAQHGFRFDTVQMPLDVMDAHFREGRERWPILSAGFPSVSTFIPAFSRARRFYCLPMCQPGGKLQASAGSPSSSGLLSFPSQGVRALRLTSGWFFIS